MVTPPDLAVFETGIVGRLLCSANWTTHIDEDADFAMECYAKGLDPLPKDTYADPDTDGAAGDLHNLEISSSML